MTTLNDSETPSYSNLATVERVLEVAHHPNADKLDIIKVLGYHAIVGRDAYKVGDLVVFIQPDSILPADKGWASEFLRYTSRGRLRAIRLRGEWSMGLVLGLKQAYDACLYNHVDGDLLQPGDDVTSYMGVTKYEPALPRNLHARGGLPFQIPRTDEERWQSIRNIEALFGLKVDVTLKIDGQSFTAYCVLPKDNPSGELSLGITSRSLDLKVGVDDNGQPFESNWHKAERKYNLLEKLKALCEKLDVSLAVRGEVYGEGIQSLSHNPHSKLPLDLALYSVYNISEHKYENYGSELSFPVVAAMLQVLAVPIIDCPILSQSIINYYDHETKTVLGQSFEGVVVKHETGSFKIINKWYDSEKE